MKISRDINTPIRKNINWNEIWEQDDLGLIYCWERGREKAIEDSSLAKSAMDGHLVILPWKGGLKQSLKIKKYGSMKYLAMWQGLRGESLFLDTEKEITLMCTHFKTEVIYTNDIAIISLEAN